MTSYIQHTDQEAEHVSVAIDNRFEVVMIRTENGLRIHVFPITDGQVWDDPFERFEVDEDEIRALEEEIGHD
jgi:hypothetical protein